ncbi:MAG: capsule biosynthesis protein, partial [Candidatus Thermoplasmatota archaeon]
HASNVAITIREEPKASTSKYAPLGTLFEDAALLLLDGFVADVMERLGETEATMRGRHAIMV